MQDLKSLLKRESNRLLSIFFTAGYPTLKSTTSIIEKLSASGVDFIEVGMPYSDPLADGQTIQYSSEVALKNGMNLDLLFEQLASIRETNATPLILMGYLGQVMRYGVERFCKQCQRIGVKNLILPDLPIDAYQNTYQTIFEQYEISNIFLITPHTSDSRIRIIDDLTNAFIYVVADANITGAKGRIADRQIDYFKRIAAMKLKNRCIVGFGIANADAFDTACRYLDGAIVGSAFIDHLKSNPDLSKIETFIHNLRTP